MLVHSAWFTMLAVAMLAIIFGRLGTPLEGRVSVLVAGAWLFVTAVQAVACALVAVTAGLRLAASLVAFYTGIAFPFIGVTFPAMAMPPLAQAWAECLPLTHFVRLLIDNGVRGSLPGRDAHHLLILGAFVVGALVVTSWPLHRLARGARAWKTS
jgi:ABC-2 type transport system permease protein